MKGAMEKDKIDTGSMTPGAQLANKKRT